MLAPIIKILANNYKGQIKIGKMDLDNNRQVPENYGVHEVPTILFFKKGRVVSHYMGVVSKDILENRIETLLQTLS